MRSSWVCWWLLLAGTLLLGQPVSGQEENYEVSLEDSGGSAEAAPLEAALEQDESMEPEEPEDLELSPELTSEEELENRARNFRGYLEEERQWGYYSLSHYKHMALRFMQQRSYDEDPNSDPSTRYRHLEDSSITVKKAFGNLITFRMFLKKGDCEDHRTTINDYLDYVTHHHGYWEPTSCQKLDCEFTVFQDVRTYHDAVIDSECRPLMLAEEMLFRDGDEYFPTPLDDDYADLPISNDDTPDVSTSDEDTHEEPTSESPILDDDTPNVPTSDEDDAALPDY